MINFKVLRPLDEHPGNSSISIKCPKCQSINFRGLTSRDNLGTFMCWDCLNILPNVILMFKYQAHRIIYYTKSTTPF